jgi:hypothetical protein
MTPDLAIKSLYVTPTLIAPGGTISVTDFMENLGMGPVGATTTVGFYLSGSCVTDVSGLTYLTGRAVPDPGGNSGSLGTTTVTVPPATAPGTYYIIANANDAHGTVVTEVSASNNTKCSAPITVVANNVDLVINSTYAPASAKRGTTISITAVTQDVLSGTAGPSTTAVYLSSTCTTTPSGSPVASISVPSLGGGANNNSTTSWAIPSSQAPAAYYLIFVADNGHVVPETNETNNTKCRAITITK